MFCASAGTRARGASRAPLECGAEASRAASWPKAAYPPGKRAGRGGKPRLRAKGGVGQCYSLRRTTTQKAPLSQGGARSARPVGEAARSKPNEGERDGAASGAHEGRAQCAKQAVVSPMRAKEAAQPVTAIAADEPSEAGSTASELANIGGPKGWSGEHTEQSAVRSHGTPRKRQRRAVRRRGATMLN